MTDLDDDAVIQIRVGDLDRIFERARPADRDPANAIEAGHFAGEIKAAEAMHRRIITEGDIIE